MSAALLSACAQPGRILGTAQGDLALPEGFEVAFNHRSDRRYRSPLTGQQRPGDDLEAFLRKALLEARQEVLMAVQELALPDLADTLIALHRRGVTVKVILENTYSTPWSRTHAADLSEHGRRRLDQLRRLADRDGDGQLSLEERRRGDAVALLQRAGVPLIDDTADGSRGSGLMHHKFVVIDGRIVVTGSANLTASGLHGDAGAPRSRGNVNHLLQIHSAELAGLFAEEFALMWGDGPGGASDSRFGRGKPERPARRVMVHGTPVEVLFAPHSPRGERHGLALIGTTLAAAEKEIDMALFVFSAQSLTEVIAERVSRGVRVRLVADPGFATRSFSEVLDLLGVALPDRRCAIEAGNAPLQRGLQGVGTPRLARGDKLHHKVAVVDGSRVISGSFNWSPAAAHTNDETLLVIHSPLLAAHFTREMNRLWSGADLGISAALRRRMDRDRRRCGNAGAP
ncbi:phosphatidylserine/phosphatidylglycerophosphate/cardiolipin synthase family protein [Synechococcus sp. RSCCF101]|uniref:phospholipase D-like domain-containing protein n=1 Tax=Synechococcus sp. RSCCF101 TaxID=2511069 RepID=UPI001245E0AF|nr:phosphatidylserine/phosphatidylglycerophosphate/cardiolipin synthase family protein [Synechococcus sp. RSCCF101]QEY32970.1 phosphatidylserine/phosphatidylglycerophosphate/cardiolipin synthase family protein [Synechococcus sp. RSCCF101]